MRFLTLLCLFLVSCIEYSIDQPHDLFKSAYNPQDIESQWWTDLHVQIEQPTVDVLWIIDDSGSMMSEQIRLLDSQEAFIDHFVGSNTDYHVGVITTGNSYLREYLGERWVSKDTVDPYAAFAYLASVGIYGSGSEKGRDQAYAALGVEMDDHSRDFIRTEAPLYLIFISDERDWSTEISKKEFVEHLWGMKTHKDMVAVSAIVPMLEPFCTWDDGRDYIRLAQKTGGVIYDICGADWSDVMRRIALTGVGIKTEFQLSRLPVQGSISVRIVEKGIVYAFEEGTDWEYDEVSNSVKFLNYAPPKLSEIYIEYMVLASAQQDDIELYEVSRRRASPYMDTGP